MGVVVTSTVFNQAEYVEQMLESVTAQTMKVNAHIVVDDGSTDGSLEILRAYAAEHDHVRVLSVTNRGMPAARNAALIALPWWCTYVVTLDGDDWINPTFARTCIRALLDDPTAQVVIPSIVRHISPDDVRDPEQPAVQHPSLSEMWEWCHAYSCAMFKKPVLVETGGFHSAMSGDCDWDMWIDIVARGYRFAYAPAAEFHYRYHDRSYTRTVAESLQPEHIEEMRRHHRRQP